MLNVQKYLIQHGLQKLQDEFYVEIHDYPTLVSLNYSQIDSPRFHPICDECRGLILEKNTWRIIAHSFDRFVNYQEGVQLGNNITPNTQRISSDIYSTKEFDISKAIVEMKLDGSLINLWFDGKSWNAATRKMAYAEGQMASGRTFHTVFFESTYKSPMFDEINSDPKWKEYTLTFELTGRENRVVTIYEDTKPFLIGARHNPSGNELTAKELDELAKRWKLDRPKYFKVQSWQELLDLVKSFHALDEGVVLKIENLEGSHWRIKLKNPSYVAIAHMRSNGTISAKNLLHLIMSGEDTEYRKYFPEDSRYIDFVQQEYEAALKSVVEIWDANKDKVTQKDYALAIIPLCKYDWQRGVLFEFRKGRDFAIVMKGCDSKKLAKSMDLKEKLQKMFAIVLDEEDEK